MFLKFLLVTIVLIYIFSRFSGFFFKWFFKAFGPTVYEKILEKQKAQQEAMRRQQAGYQAEAVKKEGMTIIIPQEKSKANQMPEEDGGEYVDYEEVK
ncbi:DUF4834 family protein [Algivirga pacifica]|uniref:DUF4834 domain-containing protein n=1 Tax=Algivirga pacifica TaxID=1162670 RepID=A0ABP9D410_9BACT